MVVHGGGGGDRRGTGYYVRGSCDGVIELTPSLTGWNPLNGHRGTLTVIHDTSHPHISRRRRLDYIIIVLYIIIIVIHNIQ